MLYKFAILGRGQCDFIFMKSRVLGYVRFSHKSINYINFGKVFKETSVKILSGGRKPDQLELVFSISRKVFYGVYLLNARCYYG